MVTSKDILRETGIRNAKTLTRWYQQGIIPKPEIKTHPSGRGKIAHWPDWVLDKCRRIVALQKKGYSLRLASEEADRNRLLEDLHFFNEPAESRETEVPVAGGKKLSLNSLLRLFTLDSIRKHTDDEEVVRPITRWLKGLDLHKSCDEILSRKGLPVLVADGREVSVAPDFSIPHLLRLSADSERCYLLLPLLQAIRNADRVLGRDLTPEPDAELLPDGKTRPRGSSVRTASPEMTLSELIKRVDAITRKGEASK